MPKIWTNPICIIGICTIGSFVAWLLWHIDISLNIHLEIDAKLLKTFGKLQICFSEMQAYTYTLQVSKEVTLTRA